MLTLTAIRNHLTTTFTTSRGRRLYQAWTHEHPILAVYDNPVDAVRAAQHHKTATLIAAFTNAAATLAFEAPYLWPATQIVHTAWNPIRRHYRHLSRVALPVGPADEFEETLSLRVHLGLHLP